MLDSEEMEMTDMKTEKSLLDDMLSKENLNRAYQQVVRNKGAEGVDGMKYTGLKDYLKEQISYGLWRTQDRSCAE